MKFFRLSSLFGLLLALAIFAAGPVWGSTDVTQTQNGIVAIGIPPDSATIVFAKFEKNYDVTCTALAGGGQMAAVSDRNYSRSMPLVAPATREPVVVRIRSEPLL